MSHRLKPSEVLKQLKINMQGKEKPDGICILFCITGYSSLVEVMDEVDINFSGNPYYPVPHSITKKSPISARARYTSGNQGVWQNSAYAQLRWLLLNWLINEFEKRGM